VELEAAGLDRADYRLAHGLAHVGHVGDVTRVVARVEGRERRDGRRPRRVAAPPELELLVAIPAAQEAEGKGWGEDEGGTANRGAAECGSSANQRRVSSPTANGRRRTHARVWRAPVASGAPGVALRRVALRGVAWRCIAWLAMRCDALRALGLDHPLGEGGERAVHALVETPARAHTQRERASERAHRKSERASERARV
jgi:hypothetical protein